MQFITQDLTSQYISNSYQNVVQRYLTGSVNYLLDGLGYVILGVSTSSVDGIVLTTDQTASWSISSSWTSKSLHSSTSDFATIASSATIADVALIADSALISLSADTASYIKGYNISGIVSESLYSYTSSIAISASWASQSLSSSYSITSSIAVSASWASQSLSSNYSITSSYLIYPSTIINVINNTTSSILSLNNTTYNSIFVNYILNDTQNFRAGSIIVLFTTISAVLSEICTTDIGNTSDDIQFLTNISGSNISLLMINASSNDYFIKYHFDVL